ncbi:MAG: DMT family transporter [Acidilobus sp.]|nr:DMT family transporter [Acidilobus sp.]
MSGSYRGYAAVTATVLIWGSAYPLIYIAERFISPVALTALRAAIGGAFLAAVYRRLQAGWRELIGGVINIAGMVSLLNLAVIMVPNPSIAAVLIYTQPLFTALMTPFALGRRVTVLQYAGVAVGVAGVVVMALGGVKLPYLIGMAIGLAGGLVWAVGTVYYEKYLARGDVPGETTFMTLSATPFVLALWPLGMRFIVTPFSVAIGLYMAVVVQGLGWLLWFIAVTELGGVRAGALSMLTPVAAVAFTLLLLHRSLTASQSLGAALAILGSGLVQVGGVI